MHWAPIRGDLDERHPELQLADPGGGVNPQQQVPGQWPAEPVVARAYMDQLGGLSDALSTRLKVALDRSESQIPDGGRDADLAAELERLAASLEENSGDGVGAGRRAALGQTLRRIAVRLR